MNTTSVLKAVLTVSFFTFAFVLSTASLEAFAGSDGRGRVAEGLDIYAGSDGRGMSEPAVASEDQENLLEGQSYITINGVTYIADTVDESLIYVGPAENPRRR